jgi:hypothetical protein
MQLLCALNALEFILAELGLNSLASARGWGTDAPECKDLIAESEIPVATGALRG